MILPFLTPLILYLAKTLKIPIKYIYKKRLKSLLEIFFLATSMYNILKKLALSKLALHLSNIYQMAEARLKKQVSYCLHFYCQKINIASAQYYRRQNQHKSVIMEDKLFVFSAICGGFYHQRCSLKLVLQKTRENPWKHLWLS